MGADPWAKLRLEVRFSKLQELCALDQNESFKNGFPAYLISVGFGHVFESVGGECFVSNECEENLFLGLTDEHDLFGLVG